MLVLIFWRRLSGKKSGAALASLASLHLLEHLSLHRHTVATASPVELLSTSNQTVHCVAGAVTSVKFHVTCHRISDIEAGNHRAELQNDHPTTSYAGEPFAHRNTDDTRSCSP